MDKEKKPKKFVKTLEEYKDSKISLETVIKMRRSVREYDKSESFSFFELSQLLHSTSYSDVKNCSVYFTVTRVKGLQSGLYKFHSEEKKIELLQIGKKYQYGLYEYGLEQSQLKDAAVVFIICSFYKDEKKKNHFEVGKISQNLNLQCIVHDIGMVVVGAFNDHKIHKILNCSKNEHPLLLLPCGKNK